jgi:hypothetical protein
MTTDNNFTEKPETQAVWDRMTYKEKNKALFERQVKLLDLFLSKHAIDRAQYEKSLYELREKLK